MGIAVYRRESVNKCRWNDRILKSPHFETTSKVIKRKIIVEH